MIKKLELFRIFVLKSPIIRESLKIKPVSRISTSKSSKKLIGAFGGLYNTPIKYLELLRNIKKKLKILIYN